MRFPYPRFPAEFEIPDEWWNEAGMAEFNRNSPAYRSKEAAGLIRLSDIEPPFRFRAHELSFRGFNRERLIAVLRGIATGDDIPPVPLKTILTDDELLGPPFRYRVRDGYHRYYASVAVGFEFLPYIS